MDRDRTVVAYQLLFRALRVVGSSSSAAPVMLRETILGTLGLGVRRVSGDKNLFLTVDRAAITGALPVTLPPERTTLLLPMDALPTPELLLGAERLHHEGFRLGISNFSWLDETAALLDLVELVHIDMRSTPVLSVPALLDRCRAHNATLLADNVATEAELSFCHELGFDLFAGAPLGNPQTVAGTVLTPEQMTTTRLISEIMQPDTDFGRLVEIVRTDPALSYRIIQLASIGRMGQTKREVRSIREALVALGLSRLRGWLPALMLQTGSSALDSALLSVLARARMAELVAEQVDPQQAGFAFTAGMISALDLLLGIPRTELAVELDIPSDLRAAAFRTDTRMGRLVNGVINYQARSNTSLMGVELDEAVAAEASAVAFAWAVETTGLIDNPTAL